ncbi:ATP-binding protein [Alphaproteobacteria bacterium]|nr:ATP-binding protein [Alphaproteobacteria bacterium]
MIDIGRLVDEFSSFARMPNAVLVKQDLTKIIQEQIQLYQNEENNIKISLENPDNSVFIDADSGLIRQLIANLLQNALDALIENNIKNPTIIVELTRDKRTAYIEIRDNGPGFESKNLSELFEPYVTGRDKGTGLGLSIAQKIIQDHAGHIKLQNYSKGGAQILITIPISSDVISKGDA